jgi:hypothetical protein
MPRSNTSNTRLRLLPLAQLLHGLETVHLPWLPMAYRIDPEADRIYVEEFRRAPIGRHSPGLRRVLNTLRFDPSGKQIILLCRKPFQEWVLGEMPALRAEPLNIDEERIFRSREEAEWEVFRRRWKAHTGQNLNLAYEETR